MHWKYRHGMLMVKSVYFSRDWWYIEMGLYRQGFISLKDWVFSNFLPIEGYRGNNGGYPIQGA